MSIEYFCLDFSSRVSVMKKKQIFIAESVPNPIKKNPIPTRYKPGDITEIIIPDIATPYDINIAFFLPILSTIIDIEIYPKKHPI